MNRSLEAVGKMPPNDPHLDVKLKLYGLLIDQFQKYNTILWQAPAALVAANTFALDRLRDKPSILLALAIFNGAFIYALWRVVGASRRIIDTMKTAQEDLLRDFPSYIPKFNERAGRSPELLLIVMWVLDGGVALYAVWNLLRTARP
jgi:hypothetical protein